MQKTKFDFATESGRLEERMAELVAAGDASALDRFITSLVVAISMVVIVMVGSLIGMCLPFVLSRFNADPATASAPLVTSIADALGVVIYFAIASAVLAGHA